MLRSVFMAGFIVLSTLTPALSAQRAVSIRNGTTQTVQIQIRGLRHHKTWTYSDNVPPNQTARWDLAGDQVLEQIAVVPDKSSRSREMLLCQKNFRSWNNEHGNWEIRIAGPRRCEILGS